MIFRGQYFNKIISLYSKEDENEAISALLVLSEAYRSKRSNEVALDRPQKLSRSDSDKSVEIVNRNLKHLYKEKLDFD